MDSVKLLVLTLALFVMLASTGCAPAGGSRAIGRKLPAAQAVGDPIYVTPPTKRLQFTGFSIVPPRGEDWHAMPSNGETRALGFDILFVKTLGPNQFVHAYAVAHRSPAQSASPSLILNEELERVVRPRGSSLQTFPNHLFRASCVRWEMTREERSQFRGVAAGESMIWISRYHGYLCSHPDAPAYVIEIGYFDTVPKNVQGPSAKEEGELFLSELSFTPLGAHVSQNQAGEKPRGLALYRSALWLSEEDTGTVAKIDPASGTKIAEINVGNKPEGLGVGLGSVWVPNWGSGTVSRIDPANNKVEAAVEVGKGPTDIAVGSGSVWVTNEKSASVSRLDPAMDMVIATIPTNGRPVAMAAGVNGVWVENFNTDEIWRIDPSTNRVVGAIRVGNGRHLILYTDTAIWVSNAADNTVSRIDPATDDVVATIPTGRTPAGLTLVGRKVWVANFGEGTISKIDPDSNSVVEAPIAVGENPFLLVGTERIIWALDVWHWTHGSLSRIDF